MSENVVSYKSLFLQLWNSVDKYIISCVFILSIISVLLMLSAGPAAADRLSIINRSFFVEKHIVFLALALLTMFVTLALDVKRAFFYALILLAILFFLMMWILLFGTPVNGARRWINLYFFNFQPTEIIKPVFIIIQSGLLSKFVVDKKFNGRLAGFVLYLLISLVIILQPDYGQWALITAIWFFLFSLTGFSLRWIIAKIIMVVSVIVFAFLFAPHTVTRIKTFLDPFEHSSYQLNQAINAIKSGGMFGVGAGGGLVKYQLPDAHTDFIFAVAIEEYGVIFGIFLIAIYLLIFTRCIIIAINLESVFKKMVIVGLGFLFTLQAFIHIAVSLRLLPAKGLTLPFISYGGSSLISSALIIGLILVFSFKLDKQHK